MIPSTPKWLLASIAFLLVLLVLFALAELLARATGHSPYRAQGPIIKIEPEGHLFEKDKILGYKNKPGKFTITQNEQLVFSATHDQYGNRITSLNSRDSLPECWIFGCSFTYGWGVNNWECYPWLVQEEMPELAIKNFGVGGYGNFQNLLQFEQELAKGKKPTIVILAYAPFHDERNVMSKNYSGVLARFNQLGPLSMPYIQLDDNGNSIRRSATMLHYRTWPLVQRSAFINSLQLNCINLQDSKLDGASVSMGIINAFNGTCMKNNITFLLAYIGAPEKFKPLEEKCNNAGVVVIDISVDLSQSWASLMPLDPHPGPQAHRMYANRLLSALVSEQFLDSLPKNQ